jgi:hypothetical protein
VSGGLGVDGIRRLSHDSGDAKGWVGVGLGAWRGRRGPGSDLVPWCRSRVGCGWVDVAVVGSVLPWSCWAGPRRRCRLVGVWCPLAVGECRVPRSWRQARALDEAWRLRQTRLNAKYRGTGECHELAGRWGRWSSGAVVEGCVVVTGAWGWSVPLATLGLAGQYLAGRRSWWGWAVGIADEALWMAYAAQTRQWMFGVSALVYAWVYARNLVAWRGFGWLPVRAREVRRGWGRGRCGAVLPGAGWRWVALVVAAPVVLGVAGWVARADVSSSPSVQSGRGGVEGLVYRRRVDLRSGDWLGDWGFVPVAGPGRTGCPR